MHRIDAPNAVPDMFGAGKPGFTDKNIQTGVKGTVVDDDWLNALQENICHVIEEAQLALEKGNHDQLLKAIKLLAWGNSQIRPIGYYTTVPVGQEEPLVYVPPFGLMHWVSDMYRSVDCGAVLLHPSAMPRPGTVKANGATLSKSTYAGLWSWATENGLVVASASWAAGTAFYAELGSDNFRLPDLRGEFLRAGDDGRGVDSGRGIGTWQDGTHITGDNGIGPAVHGIGNLATVNVDPPDGVARDLYHMPTANILSDKFSYWGRVRPRNVALIACIKF